MFLEKRVLETARALSMVVDQQLATMQASATALAASPFLVSGNLKAFHKQAQTLLQNYPAYDVVLSNANGHSFLNAHLPFGTPLPPRRVSDVTRKVFETGKPGITNLYKGERTGRYLFGIEVPVFRQGRVVYDILLAEHAEEFAAVFAQQVIPPHWTIAVLDANHVLVARSTNPETSVGQLTNPALVRRANEVQEGTVELANREGVPSLNIFHQSSANGWMVAIGFPKALMLAEIWQWLKWIIGGVVLLSAVAIALAIFLAKRISGSIQALIAPAAALGSGEPVQIGQLDLAETNELGRSLVKASQLLQQRTAERERLLAQSEQQSQFLDKLISSAPVGVAVLGRDFRYLLANSHYRAIPGNEQTPMVGRSVAEIFSPEVARIIQFYVQQVFDTGKELVIPEYEVNFGPGRERTWWNIWETPLGDGTGNIESALIVTHEVTEQVQTRERIQQLAKEAQTSRQHLQEIIDGATETVVFVKDVEGRFITANTAFEKLLGIKRDDLCGKTDYDLITKDRADTYLAVDAQVLKTGKPIQIEEVALLADGKEHIFLANKFPLFDATGKPYALCSISADITERKRVEASLKADLSALTQMHELSEKVLGAKGIQPLLQDVMDAAVAITKADHGTLQLLDGESLRIVAHCGHQQPFLDFFASAENRASVCGAAVLSGKRVVVPDVEESSLFAGTPSLPVLREAGVRAVQSTPLVNRTGVLLGILTTQWATPYCPSEHDLWRIDLLARQAADLIENAKAELTIAHVASFPELNPNPIFETDLEGNFTYANPAAHKLFPDLLAGGAGHPLLVEWCSTAAELTAGSKETVVREIASGGKVFQQTIHRPKNLPVLRAYFADITDRKRAEEALLRAEKLASAGRMAATVAHEINNPLEALTNLLFLVNSLNELPPSARQYLEVADAELKRIAHITRQSLGFYRESNAPALTSVNAVLESAVDLLKSRIKTKRAVIEKQWNQDVEVTAVAGELRQVFSNLLANGLDAIDEEGTIKLRVSAGAAANGHRRVRVTVADDGKGIPASARPHIFEPFFTTKGTTGTGLGLWVSKQIIEKHGGTIRMRSHTDATRRGTVFSIVLPLQPAAEAHRQSAGA
jgi:PAS domain S-box-containing protein